MPILKALRAGGIPYLGTGTWALKRTHPTIMGTYVLSDCDLLIPFDLRVIRKAVDLLQKDQWQVCLWGQAVDASLGDDILKGKFYLRAKRGALSLDLTYEYPPLSWRELCERSYAVDGCTLVDPAIILAFKKMRGRVKDLALIRVFDSYVG